MIRGRSLCVALVVASVTVLTAGSARAQGALTTQGFGYPPAGSARGRLGQVAVSLNSMRRPR
jgi:hypothetical protein